jgi:predicted acylesterase/phospholipase RssA
VQYVASRGITPAIITGSSVGAINGAKLAEGDGALNELEQIWLGLRYRQDMWLEEPWFTTLRRTACPLSVRAHDLAAPL